MQGGRRPAWRPSVVRIETVGGLERVGEMLVGTGPTTGLVVSADGYIVSSAFNFAQKPARSWSTLPRRRAARGQAGGHRPQPDAGAAEGRSRRAAAGARGRAATAKCASANGPWPWAARSKPTSPTCRSASSAPCDRIWGKAIQTDAKISPNNYGGPLVDIAGRVLGVLVPMSPAGRRRSGRRRVVRLGHRLCRAARRRAGGAAQAEAGRTCSRAAGHQHQGRRSSTPTCP